MTHRRKRLNRLRFCPVGAVPGSINRLTPETNLEMELFAWSSDRFVEHRISSLSGIEKLRDGLPMMWINVPSTPGGKTLLEFQRSFGLHPLALEDVQHPTHRAKVESFGEILFVLLPIPTQVDGEFELEQLAMFVGPNFVLTIQERSGGDCFDHVRHRIRLHEGRVRDKGSPYFAFALIDSAIDSYFPIVNAMGEKVDAIEEALVGSRAAPDLYAVRSSKRELSRVRQAIWPLRDALTSMMTLESWFDMEHRLYLRNALDHVMRLIDMLDSDRSMASDLMELAIAIANAKLAVVTKFLTMIATVFIPLTFIAGVYGMNFDFMPELHWRYGYAFSLAVMAITVVGILFTFWWRGWFDSSMRSTQGSRAKRS